MSKRTVRKPAPKPDLKALIRRMSRVEETALERRAETNVQRSIVALTSEPAMTLIGQVDIKFSAAEEKVLSEAVNDDDVSIKPSGQPYLSHPVYTRWLNRAFGRTGWALVPTTVPIFKDDMVARHFVLWIHKKPAAEAIGAQDYFVTNPDQSLDEAVEACVAYALRRCCKRLGIGLELWDKRWIHRFLATHGTIVKAEVWDRRKNQYVLKDQWRRKDDPALKGEVAGRSSSIPPAEAQRAQLEHVPDYSQSEQPRAAMPPRGGSGKVITERQVVRLHTIANNVGRDMDSIHDWLEREFGVASTKAILMRDYDYICNAIESGKPLPRRDR